MKKRKRKMTTATMMMMLPGTTSSNYDEVMDYRMLLLLQLDFQFRGLASFTFRDSSSLLSTSASVTVRLCFIIATQLFKTHMEVARNILRSFQQTRPYSTKLPSVLTHMEVDRNILRSFQQTRPYSTKKHSPEVLSFLKKNGFTSAQLNRFVTSYPRVVNISVHSIQEKLDFLLDFGVPKADIPGIIAGDFNILNSRTERVARIFESYRKFLGTKEAVIKLMKVYEKLHVADPETTLVPNVLILKTYGISHEDIHNFLFSSYTRFFLQSPHKMQETLKKAEEMGTKRDSPLFLYAAWAVQTMSTETLQTKINMFRHIGFTEKDLSSMFRTAPMSISVSPRRIAEVVDVVLHSGKYDLSCIIRDPVCLTRSVQNLYKPRLEVLNVLERNGVLQKWPAFSTLGRYPVHKFYRLYVEPNKDILGQDLILKCSKSKVRRTKLLRALEKETAASSVAIEASEKKKTASSVDPLIESNGAGSIVVEVEYIDSENLKDVEDVEDCVQALLSGLGSKDWVSVCDALNNVRRLSIFHKETIKDMLNDLISSIVKSMKNPRSALCKTAIMTSADIFKVYNDDIIDSVDPMLVQLLLKSSQDKKFVCEAADNALIALTSWVSPLLLLPKLHPYIKDKNPRIRAKASLCISRIVPRLGVDGIGAFGIEKLIQIGASQLSDKLPASRDAARTLLLELQSVYEKSHVLEPTATPEEPLVASWEHFCQSKLSPLSAQAVLRATTTAREGLVTSS